MRRKLLAEGKNASLVVLGEKGKAQLQRDRREMIAGTVTELGKYKMTFAQVRPAAGNISIVRKLCTCGTLWPKEAVTSASSRVSLLAAAAAAVVQASGVAEELMKTEYDVARLIYNRFRSAIAYKPTIATVLSPDVRGPLCTLLDPYVSLQLSIPDQDVLIATVSPACYWQ